MNQPSTAFSNEDRKILKQLFSVIGLFVACMIGLAIAINVVM